MLSGIILLTQQSCVDTSYDDYDTSGEFNIGAFPIGNIDTLKMDNFIPLGSLDLPPVILPPNAQYAITDTLDIFDEDIIEQFFYPGGEVGIMIDTVKADFGASNGSMVATVYFEVLRSDRSNTGITPKKFEIANGNKVNSEIDFSGTDMTKMQKTDTQLPAQYLLVTIVLANPGTTNMTTLSTQGYVLFKGVKLAGKVHFT